MAIMDIVMWSVTTVWYLSAGIVIVNLMSMITSKWLMVRYHIQHGYTLNKELLSLFQAGWNGTV